MKHSSYNPTQARSFSTRIGAAVGLLLTLGLLLAGSASATFEEVGTFANSEELRWNSSDIAVNSTGTGGVPAGTVYVVGTGIAGVSRYSAKGEFLDKWGSSIARGVAVDQATGNVYVVQEIGKVGEDVVLVFNADGSQLIATFGEFAPPNDSIDDSPAKLHNHYGLDRAFGGIAVDSAGTVYLSDRKFPTSESTTVGARVMVFKPQSPGDYEHYVYTGRTHDIASSDDFGRPQPTALALDSAGNLYMSVGDENAILEFVPDEPTTPACQFKLSAGGIQAMTVSPERGEPFYYSYKNKKVHQLSACNSQGKFEETSTIAVEPGPDSLYALGFNPALAWEPSRAPGVLYAIDSTGVLGLGHIYAPAVIRSPVIEAESVSSVTASTATLSAQINPKGSETRYAFQYIAAAAYEANEPADRFAGASEAPLGGAALGSGQAALTAAVAVVGLQSDTEYRYRVIATSHCEPDDEEKACEASGSAEIFRTFPAEAPELPDDRAYELVSPVQKHGGEVFPADPATSTCGECKPGALPIVHAPMQSAPDGEAVVYEGFPFSYFEGATIENEYLSKRTSSGWQTTILSPLLHRKGVYGGYKAFNAELTEGVLHQINPSLTPDAPSEYTNLYTQPTATPAALTPLLTTAPPNRPPGLNFELTYAGASADLSHIFFAGNVALTEETPFAPEAVDGGQQKYNLYESVGGQLRLVNVQPGNAESLPGAAFGSGFQFAKIGAGDPANYSHAISDDGSRVFWSSESGQVYVRENGESSRAIPDPGKFFSASDDGSQVLLSNGHLYDLETESTIDLTEGKGGFQGIVGQSEDLSRLYFVDTAVLDEDANERGAKAEAGKPNLYAWVEGDIAFVGGLNDTGQLPDTEDWNVSPVRRRAEASPDGRWLAFGSVEPLTGYDNVGPCGKEATPPLATIPGPCSEVFLYDSATGKLACVSCNPSNARPLGLSRPPLNGTAEGSVPQMRYLTDSGRLYFDSRDSLSPFDTNDGVEDVYQYEPNGVGSCKREAGCVSLISAGHEPIDSNFLAVDATGKNVFFTTRDQLVLKDRDDLIDLYVAREGGGIASETETARGECQGEACQAVIVAPNDPTPGSSTFEGAGNVDEKKAKKKKHKKKHAKKQKSHKRAANNNRGGAK